MVTELTDHDFEERVIKAETPLLVDFYAPWCGPCRMTAPVIEKLSKDYNGKFNFYKLNVDENPKTAGKYRVMSIPTLLFFKNGDKVDSVVGAVPEGELKPKIDALI